MRPQEAVRYAALSESVTRNLARLFTSFAWFEDDLCLILVTALAFVAQRGWYILYFLVKPNTPLPFALRGRADI